MSIYEAQIRLYSYEALIMVGQLCVQRKCPETGKAILRELRARHRLAAAAQEPLETCAA